MKFPSLSLIVGKTNSGKTSLLRRLIYENQGLEQNFDFIFVFCPTSEFSGDYDWLPKKCVIPEYDEEFLQQIWDLMGEAKKAELNLRCLIILDDCVGADKLNPHQSKLFEKIAASSRHRNISMFILSQQITKLCSPTLRSNANYIFITKVNNESLNTIYDCTSGFSSRKDFQQFVAEKCVNYNAVCIDNLDQQGNNAYVIPSMKVPKFRLRFFT